MIPPQAKGSMSSVLRTLLWGVVVLALALTVTAIYIFLRPVPAHLAEPERISLAAGQKFALSDLPMGIKYRLRACEKKAIVKVSIGPWTSGWTEVLPNPLDDVRRDLRIDGRSGGELILEAKDETGRLLLFKHRAKASCMHVDEFAPADGKALGEPPEVPFSCDMVLLKELDRDALRAMKALLFRRAALSKGLPADHVLPASALSDRQRKCLNRLEALEKSAPPSSSSASPSEGRSGAPERVTSTKE